MFILFSMVFGPNALMRGTRVLKITRPATLTLPCLQYNHKPNARMQSQVLDLRLTLDHLIWLGLGKIMQPLTN